MVRSGNTTTSLNPSTILWHRCVHVPALQHWASHLYKTARNDLVSSLPRLSAEPPYPCWRVRTPSLTTQARGLTVTQLVSLEPSCLGDTSPAQFHGYNTLGIAGDQVQKAPPSHADCFSFTPVEIKEDTRAATADDGVVATREAASKSIPNPRRAETCPRSFTRTV